jgi:hypothetical protein
MSRGQREYWERRIYNAFSGRLEAQKKTAAKAQETQAAKIARELGVEKDLKALARMETLQKSVVDRLAAVCQERGIVCWSQQPKEILKVLASDTVTVVRAAEQERDKLLSCLHKACGAAELRTSVAKIERALAVMEGAQA